MSDQEEMKFYPFNALEQFMLDDFKKVVLAIALEAAVNAPDDLQKAVALHTKRNVSIPGFRNALKAPLSLRVKHLSGTFGKTSGFVGAVVQLWYSARPDLARQVYDLMTGLGWELPPLDLDRTRLPGFLLTWPEDSDFDVINEAFARAHPDSTATEDDVSLMAVWLSGRLPVELVPRAELEKLELPEG